jgi:hypothetical protein
MEENTALQRRHDVFNITVLYITKIEWKTGWTDEGQQNTLWEQNGLCPGGGGRKRRFKI